MERTEKDVESYQTWSELAGYFDGDGTVEFSVGPFTIHIRLAFDENWRAHLVGIANFLNARGITTSAVRKKESYNTWHVVVSNISGVVRMAKAMRPHTVKKKGELQGVIDYFEDKITGNDFVQLMNAEVKSGRRTGKQRTVGPNMSHSEGVLESRRLGEAKRRLKRITPIPHVIMKEILKDWREERLGPTDLSRRRGYSVKVIRRAISDEAA